MLWIDNDKVAATRYELGLHREDFVIDVSFSREAKLSHSPTIVFEDIRLNDEIDERLLQVFQQA